MEQQYKRLHVMGTGGVGFYALLGLSRSGISADAIIAYDDDTLAGGLGAIRLPSASAVTRKIDLARGFIRNFNGGGQPPQFVAAKFTGTEVDAGDLMVDCSDMATGSYASATSRKSIWRRAQDKGARCIRVSYEGKESIVVVAEGLPLESEAGKRVGGYDSVPSLALSLAAGGVASEVIAMIWHEVVPYVDFQISLRQLVGLSDGALGAAYK